MYSGTMPQPKPDRRARGQMVISLSGMLTNAATAADAGSDRGYGYMLRQLHEHLEELRERHLSGDKTAIDEFFSLYVKD